MSLVRCAHGLGKGSVTWPPRVLGVMWDRAGGNERRGHAVGPASQDSTDEPQEFRDVARESLPANFSKGQCVVCLRWYKYIRHYYSLLKREA